MAIHRRMQSAAIERHRDQSLHSAALPIHSPFSLLQELEAEPGELQPTVAGFYAIVATANDCC